MKKIMLYIFLIVFVILISFLYYLGFFSRIVIQEKETGPFVLVYEDHKGNYKGTAKVQNDIYETLLGKYNIETYKGFGVYYDNPKIVAEENLRSIAGCILEEKDLDKVEKLKEEGMKIKEIGKEQSLVVEFPFKNPLSIMIGIVKVYPKFEAYAKEHNLIASETMEIYDIPAGKIIYIMKNNK